MAPIVKYFSSWLFIYWDLYFYPKVFFSSVTKNTGMIPFRLFFAFYLLCKFDSVCVVKTTDDPGFKFIYLLTGCETQVI